MSLSYLVVAEEAGEGQISFFLVFFPYQHQLQNACGG